MPIFGQFFALLPAQFSHILWHIVGLFPIVAHYQSIIVGSVFCPFPATHWQWLPPYPAMVTVTYAPITRWSSWSVRYCSASHLIIALVKLTSPTFCCYPRMIVTIFNISSEFLGHKLTLKLEKW